MRSSKYTVEQRDKALLQYKEGRPAIVIAREMGVSLQTFYRWKRIQGAPRARPVKKNQSISNSLAVENHELKKLVAELSLENRRLQHELSK